MATIPLRYSLSRSSWLDPTSKWRSPLFPSSHLLLASYPGTGMSARLQLVHPLYVFRPFQANNTIDNVVYSGYLPYSDPYYSTPPSRIFRKINGNGPVEDVTLIDLQCGGYTAGGIVGSAPAALTAPVTPGSTVSLLWTQWYEYLWISWGLWVLTCYIGPILTRYFSTSTDAKPPSSLTTECL